MKDLELFEAARDRLIAKVNATHEQASRIVRPFTITNLMAVMAIGFFAIWAVRTLQARERQKQLARYY